MSGIMAITQAPSWKCWNSAAAASEVLDTTVTIDFDSVLLPFDAIRRPFDCRSTTDESQSCNRRITSDVMP